MERDRQRKLDKKIKLIKKIRKNEYLKINFKCNYLLEYIFS